MPLTDQQAQDIAAHAVEARQRRRELQQLESNGSWLDARDARRKAAEADAQLEAAIAATEAAS